MTPVRIYLSFCRKDAPHAAELQKHLAMLVRQRKIAVWHAGLIEVGSESDGVAERELGAAEIFVPLLSSDYFGDERCGEELAAALGRRKEGGLRIIPILVRPVDLVGEELGRLRRFPLDDRPVSKWLDPDEAWVEVSQGLRQLIGDAEKQKARYRGDKQAPTTGGALGEIRRRWALLVGVNDFEDPSYQSLSYCVEDVQRMESLLSRCGYTVIALHDRCDGRRLPRRNNVKAELAGICSRMQREDLLLVYFGCHGVLDPKRGKPTLVLRDTDSRILGDSGLLLSDVEDLMAEGAARRQVLVLDACHAGVQVGRGHGDPAFIRSAYELAEGFAVLAASTAQQVAFDDPEHRAGAFSRFLLEALGGAAMRDGHRFVTVNDAYLHVRAALSDWTLQRGLGLQEPTLRLAGIGDMILCDYRDRPAP